MARASSSGGYREDVIDLDAGGTVMSGVNLGDDGCNGTTTCP